MKRRVDTESVSLAALFIMPGFPPGLSPFSSGLAGSLSSSLHENYSMGELKEWGVHSVEQLAVSHSLVSHTKGARSTREVEDEQRLQ